MINEGPTRSEIIFVPIFAMLGFLYFSANNPFLRQTPGNVFALDYHADSLVVTEIKIDQEFPSTSNGRYDQIRMESKDGNIGVLALDYHGYFNGSYLVDRYSPDFFEVTTFMSSDSVSDTFGNSNLDSRNLFEFDMDDHIKPEWTHRINRELIKYRQSLRVSGN